MKILVIGGTGFIGVHIVRHIISEGHTVAVYHRGHTQAILPDSVQQILDSQSVIPIQRFPKKLFDFGPDVVIHTIAMGSPDAQAAAGAFAGHAGRLVLLSSGDVYRAYGQFIGIEPGPPDEGLLSEDSPLRTALFPLIAPKLLLMKHFNIGTKRSSLNGPFSAPLICPQQSCGSPKSMDRAGTRIFPQSIDTASTPSGAGPTDLLKTWLLRLHLRRHILLPGVEFITLAKRIHLQSLSVWRGCHD